MAKKTFHGRPILSGKLEGQATVSRIGLNTLSTYKAVMFGGVKDKAVCSDGDNKELYGKDITGAILCLPQTIGSSSSSSLLLTMAEQGLGPKAWLFANHIDSLAAGGLVMADVWLEKRSVTVDLLGDEFLEAVKTGDPVKVHADGTVEVG